MGGGVPLLRPIGSIGGAPAAVPMDRQSIERRQDLLAQLDTDAVEFRNVSKAASTIRNRDARTRKWNDFTRLTGSAEWPPSLDAYIRYVTWLGTIGLKGGPMSYSSVLSYSSHVSLLARVEYPAMEDLHAHPRTKETLRGVARVLGENVLKARPCTLADLVRAHGAMLVDPSRRNVTAVCMASVALFGALRLGNLVGAKPAVARRLALGNARVPDPARYFQPILLKDVRFALDRQSCVISIRRSKVDQTGGDHHEFQLEALTRCVEACPIRALERWIRVVKPTPETPLAGYEAGGRTFAREQFITTFRALVGDEPLPVNLVSKDEVRASHTGHSFRRGFMLMCVVLGVPLHLAMLHGQWRSAGTAMEYAASVIQRCPVAMAMNSQAPDFALADMLGRSASVLAGYDAQTRR